MATVGFKAPGKGANVEAEKAAKFLGVSTDCLTLAAQACPWLNRRRHGPKVLYSTERIALLQAMLDAGAIGWEIFSRTAQERPATPRNAPKGSRGEGEETA